MERVVPYVKDGRSCTTIHIPSCLPSDAVVTPINSVFEKNEHRLTENRTKDKNPERLQRPAGTCRRKLECTSYRKSPESNSDVFRKLQSFWEQKSGKTNGVNKGSRIVNGETRTCIHPYYSTPRTLGSSLGQDYLQPVRLSSSAKTGNRDTADSDVNDVIWFTPYTPAPGDKSELDPTSSPPEIVRPARNSTHVPPECNKSHERSVGTCDMTRDVNDLLPDKKDLIHDILCVFLNPNHLINTDDNAVNGGKSVTDKGERCCGKIDLLRCCDQIHLEEMESILDSSREETTNDTPSTVVFSNYDVTADLDKPKSQLERPQPIENVQSHKVSILNVEAQDTCDVENKVQRSSSHIRSMSSFTKKTSFGMSADSVGEAAQKDVSLCTDYIAGNVTDIPTSIYEANHFTIDCYDITINGTGPVYPTENYRAGTQSGTSCTCQHPPRETRTLPDSIPTYQRRVLRPSIRPMIHSTPITRAIPPIGPGKITDHKSTRTVLPSCRSTTPATSYFPRNRRKLDRQFKAMSSKAVHSNAFRKCKSTSMLKTGDGTPIRNDELFSSETSNIVQTSNNHLVVQASYKRNTLRPSKRRSIEERPKKRYIDQPSNKRRIDQPSNKRRIDQPSKPYSIVHSTQNHSIVQSSSHSHHSSNYCYVQSPGVRHISKHSKHRHIARPSSYRNIAESSNNRHSIRVSNYSHSVQSSSSHDFVQPSNPRHIVKTFNNRQIVLSSDYRHIVQSPDYSPIVQSANCHQGAQFEDTISDATCDHKSKEKSDRGALRKMVQSIRNKLKKYITHRKK